MAEELRRVRTQFVERVSEDMIGQLIDDLLDDKILNDGESESILKKDSKRTAQARNLFDNVRRKGDEASRKFIAYLQERDPALSKTLGLVPPPPLQAPQPLHAPQPLQAPQPAARVQLQQDDWSDTLILSTEDFWREKQGEMERNETYRVSRESVRSRVALLITNIDFSDPAMNRAGAEADHNNMERLLRGLGYEVVPYKNKTAEEMDAALTDFAKHPKLKETDSVFVVLMSHGKRDLVVGVKHTKAKPDEFRIDDIFRRLNSGNCPMLLGKPKVIIIQACRGSLDGSVLVNVDDVQGDDFRPPGPAPCEDDITDDKVQCVPIEQDFICFLSCTPDCLSYRHTIRGAFLIQYIVQVFNTFAHKDEIKRLFQRVTRLCGEFVHGNKRQIPNIDRCSLRSDFYLFPGL